MSADSFTWGLCPAYSRIPASARDGASYSPRDALDTPPVHLNRFRSSAAGAVSNRNECGAAVMCIFLLHSTFRPQNGNFFSLFGLHYAVVL